MDKAQGAEARVMQWLLQSQCASGVIGSSHPTAHFSPLPYIKCFHNWYLFIICHQFKQRKKNHIPLPCEKIYIIGRLKASAADVRIGKHGIHLCSCSVPIFEGFFIRKYSAHRTSSTSAVTSVMFIPCSTQNTLQAFPNED